MNRGNFLHIAQMEGKRKKHAVEYDCKSCWKCISTQLFYAQSALFNTKKIVYILKRSSVDSQSVMELRNVFQVALLCIELTSQNFFYSFFSLTFVCSLALCCTPQKLFPYLFFFVGSYMVFVSVLFLFLFLKKISFQKKKHKKV